MKQETKTAKKFMIAITVCVFILLLTITYFPVGDWFSEEYKCCISYWEEHSNISMNQEGIKIDIEIGPKCVISKTTTFGTYYHEITLNDAIKWCATEELKNE